MASPGCLKCTYEVSEKNENGNGNFVCNECLSDEYRLTENNVCEKCQLANCEKCFFNKSDNENVECDICDEGYYKNSAGECEVCYSVSIYGGDCKVCSENDTEYNTCYCHDGFTKIGNSTCFQCTNGCSECKYDLLNNNTECIRCYTNYALDSNKNCIFCGEGCGYCELDAKNNPICKYCDMGTLSVNNKCLMCSSGCSKCYMDRNEKICTECKYYYALNSENNICQYCDDTEDTGDGCERCTYNKNNKKYECLKCWNNDYTYINNTLQCFHNTNKNQSYLYGCLNATFNEITKKYECYYCKNDFAKVKNEKRCIKPIEENLSSYCLEVENINTSENPLYSCSKCPDNYAFVITNSNRVKNCYERKDELSYCLEGKIENEKNICEKCVENAKLTQENKCECNFGFFGYNDLYCYECDYDIYENQGCDASKGCNYDLSNDELVCNECKEGYFKNTNGQCFSCFAEIGNCNKCKLEIKGDKKKLICENCLSLYYLNDKKDTCELNECEEYPDISPGCIICKDKLNEYKSNNKCQECKFGYFKTKDDKCVYCR